MTGLARREILGSRSGRRARASPACRVRPRHLRKPPEELVRVGPDGTVRHLVVAARAARGPAAGPAVRLGADPAGRRRHRACCTLWTRGRPAQMRTGMRVRPRWAEQPGRAHHRHRLLRGRRAGRDAARRRHRRRAAADPAGRRLTHGHDDHHAGAPALPAQRLGGGEPLPPVAEGRQDHRPALPGLRQGLRAAARRLPGRRRADDDRRRTARRRHRHHVLRGERAVPGPAGARRRTWPLRSCWTAPTSRSSTSSSSCDPADVRMGMRVEAVWKPREEWGTTAENIDHFRADRRAGRAVRVLRTPPVRNSDVSDVAVIGFAEAPNVRQHRRHHQRRGDAGADLPRGVRPDRADQGRHRLLVLGLVRLPGRAGPSPSSRRSTRSARSRR